ncbi:hypothetical protein MMC13_001426 [Lambiella insularis]|nr:hypothetical protein [Lambiella insularis]
MLLPLSLLPLLIALTSARPPIPYDQAGYTRLRLPREPTLATFPGSLGNIHVPAITSSGSPSLPFLVADVAVATYAEAAQRSCDVQHARCAQAVSAGALDFRLEDCGRQKDLCGQVQSKAVTRCFYGVDGCTASPVLEAEEGVGDLRVQARGWRA